MSEAQDLSRYALNLAIWIEDILDGSHAEWTGEDKAKIKDDIDDLYSVIGDMTPATYRAWTEYEKNGPLFIVNWFVERNGVPLKSKRAFHSLEKFEDLDGFRWVDGRTRQSQFFAMEILLAEGYDLEDARRAYQAFARDVIGNFEKGEENILTSEDVAEWMDEFEVSSSTSSSTSSSLDKEEGDGQE